jgi:large subunit ribosomal protein L20
MPRVVNGTVSRRRRKKILKMAKGYRSVRSTAFRKAREAVEHGLSYAYRDRKNRKREFRRLWIARINAAVKPYMNWL